ncbi:bifunctional 2-polyprenyl-6-hydroxyphenol methylase/3-demethylubiquinol 3-O-methyltransferase UbiG [Geothrix limicola]|uniref:bifunctional 2-polyprenyl-6-hydroxyphenol methylase/3-demethylubiquinol 3-O-methyltransferase UbiG n=1 Tax=Geothrix limicola TaxID=2927978 RepID=UPI00255325D3|nr:bifunctional 2-polyprenyl-6-hydroxyphenol methylase/3-demethylubiquinol 3-O-methyltransferase UbiG [Geothrix limicola]
MLDSLVFLACLVLPVLVAPTPSNIRLFSGMAVCSCLLITKDEFIHQRLCSGGEHWLHAVLFILHPIVLLATAMLWIDLGSAALSQTFPRPLAAWLLQLQAALVFGFLVYQIAEWFWRARWEGKGPEINNSIYEDLGDRWYTTTDDPVALLRAESRLRTSWVQADLHAAFGEEALAILDVACGAGFLSNPLAQAGHEVTGIDLSLSSLEVAKRHDHTRSVTYLPMDARCLSFPDARFDVVCMMDFLEHLPEKEEVLREASRVLKPGGWFFFHTFNRTLLSWLIGIKGVEWFVKNTPAHMHVYRLFLKPSELRDLCARQHLVVEEVRGVRPRIFSWAFWKLLLTGRVSDQFQFVFTHSQSIGYCGHARKLTALLARPVP